MRSFIWHPVYDIRVTSACTIFFLLAEALNRQVHSSRREKIIGDLVYLDRIIPKEVGRQSNGSDIMGVSGEDKGTPRKCKT